MVRSTILPPVTFDDVAGLETVFTSESYMGTIRPDEAQFLDLHACAFVPLAETMPIA